MGLYEPPPSDCHAGRLRPPLGNRFAKIASHILSVGSRLKKSRIEEALEEYSTSPPFEVPQSQHLFKGQPQSRHFTIFRSDLIDLLVTRIPQIRLLGQVSPPPSWSPLHLVVAITGPSRKSCTMRASDIRQQKVVPVWDDHFILQVLEAQGRVKLLRFAKALWRQLDCSSVDKT